MPQTALIAADPDRAAGRRRLLPLMSAVLVLGAVFFAVTSLYELRSLYARLEQPRLDLAALFEDRPAPGRWIRGWEEKTT